MTFRVEVRGQPNHEYYMWYQEAGAWLRGKDRRVGRLWNDDEARKFLKDLMSVGKIQVGGTSFRGRPTKSSWFADTVIVAVDPSKYKQFVLLAMMCKPDEFEEIAPDTFRMWWD